MVGRVTGQVISTNKVETLKGTKLLIVETVALETQKPTGDCAIRSARLPKP